MSEVLSLPAQFEAATTEVSNIRLSLLRRRFSADALQVAFDMPGVDTENLFQLDATEAAQLQELDRQMADALVNDRRMLSTIGVNTLVAHSLGVIEGFGLNSTYAVTPGTVGLQRVEANDGYYILSTERDKFTARVAPFVGGLVAAPAGQEGAPSAGIDPEAMAKYLTGYLAPEATEALRAVALPKLRGILRTVQ